MYVALSHLSMWSPRFCISHEYIIFWQVHSRNPYITYMHLIMYSIIIMHGKDSIPIHKVKRNTYATCLQYLESILRLCGLIVQCLITLIIHIYLLKSISLVYVRFCHHQYKLKMYYHQSILQYIGMHGWGEQTNMLTAHSHHWHQS